MSHKIPPKNTPSDIVSFGGFSGRGKKLFHRSIKQITEYCDFRYEMQDSDGVGYFFYQELQRGSISLSIQKDRIFDFSPIPKTNSEGKIKPINIRTQ